MFSIYFILSLGFLSLFLSPFLDSIPLDPDRYFSVPTSKARPLGVEGLGNWTAVSFWNEKAAATGHAQ